MTAPAPPTPTPPQYTVGAVKQDTTNTQAVAVRTSIPTTAGSDKEWGVMTVADGGHYATWDQVQTWADLHAAPGGS